MANPEQLARLQRSVEEWNQWREENEGVQVDLSGAKLNGAKLTRADLRGANLTRAYLRGANLTGANLSNADLAGAILDVAYLNRADLSNADLTTAILAGAKLFRANLLGANLTSANLIEANLTEADLTEADLSRTNFGRTKLNGTDLSRVRLWNTIFADTRLADATGLDNCVHLGPSTLDHRTLAKSGDLPLEFLEGVGLTDEQIRAYLGEDTLTIEFTSARYGQLIPIELALRTRLGEDYIVEKDADRIVVKLDSPDQFQAALEAVIPVLMALEAASPGESKRLGVEPKEGPSEQIESEELMAVLLYLVQRFDEEHPQAKLTAGQEAIVEGVKSGLRGVLGLALQKFFEGAAERELPIYQRYKPALEGLKGVAELPAHEEEPPKQLPPASDEDT